MQVTEMKTMNLQKGYFIVVSFLSLFAVQHTTNVLALNDFSEERHFFNISNYSFGSSSNSGNQTNNRLVKKTLVSFAIENTLLTIGRGTFATAVNQLGSTYKSSLLDCLEHPQYLREVLKRHGEDVYKASINSIKTKLHEFSMDKEIAEFLHEISK